MATTKVKVTLDSGGVRELLSSDGVRGALTGPAERVLSGAQAGAPVASGAYKRSLRIMDATTDRAVKRVGATVPYALVVEAKTGNLARAIGGA